jgi:hypothetical protein
MQSIHHMPKKTSTLPKVVRLKLHITNKHSVLGMAVVALNKKNFIENKRAAIVKLLGLFYYSETLSSIGNTGNILIVEGNLAKKSLC